jgi:radical SAM protein with 4Fe4S-binding SPASM domain
MKCRAIPTVGIDSYQSRLNTDSQGRNVPLSGSLELTTRCNLNCVHCYHAKPSSIANLLGSELTSKELLSILDQIVEAGCLWLLVTGGEPLLRRDFATVYRYAKKKGLLVTLFTNGTLVTPHVADLLAEWTPSSIEVSLYGRTQATYEAVTGVPGSFKRCISGIESLLDRKLPLKLKSTLSTLNCHELPDMQRYAEELGVEFRFDPVLIARLDGSGAPTAFRIPPEQVIALDWTDERRVKEIREFAVRVFEPPPGPDLLYKCGAGVNTFHIDAEGRLTACLLSRQASYDLRSRTFREGWQKFIPRVRGQKRTKRNQCTDCALATLCGLCPGLAMLEHGDAEESIGYLCRIAHLRHETVVRGGERETNR